MSPERPETPLEKISQGLLEHIEQLPRYQERDVVMRPSTTEYFDAEQVLDVLALLTSAPASEGALMTPMEADEARIDCEMAAAKIERIRDELDKAINLLPMNIGTSLQQPRSILLQADKMLQRLKSDLGFPKAGLFTTKEQS